MIILLTGSTEAGAVRDESQMSGMIGNSATLTLIRSEIAQTGLPHTRQEAANHGRAGQKTPIQQRKGCGGGVGEERRVERDSGTASKSGEGDVFHLNCQIQLQTSPDTDTHEDSPIVTQTGELTNAAVDIVQQNQKQDELSPNSQVNHSSHNKSKNMAFNLMFWLRTQVVHFKSLGIPV